MFRKVFLGLVVGCGALLPGVGGAQELPPASLEPVPPVAAGGGACVSPAPPERSCRALNIHLLQEQELKVVPHAALHEVLTRSPIMDVEIEYREEKRPCTVMVLKPRWEERTVTTMTAVPEVTTDPGTGCLHIEYKQVPQCKTVQVQVFDQVPETREYVVKVPVLRSVEKQALYRSFVLDTTPRPAVVGTLKLIAIPNDITIPAPPCPTPCATPPTGHPGFALPAPAPLKPTRPEAGNDSGGRSPMLPPPRTLAPDQPEGGSLPPAERGTP
jgi:hypothetical protein